MISNLDASTERFLTDLSRSSRRIETAQRQLTSGRRINSASDDPSNLATLFESRAQLDRNEQSRIDLGRFKTEIDVAEGVMQQAVMAMERARVLGAQGANGSAHLSMRASLVQEVGVLMQSIVSIANTSLEGRYIFSGDADQTAPYTLDLSLALPVSAYGGTPATRRALDPGGNTFAVSRSAEEIFNSANAGSNVLTSLNDLRVALLANDEAAVRAAIPNVDTATTYLNDQLAFFGAAQNRVNGALILAQHKATHLRQQIGSLEDADTVAAIAELNEATTAREVALSARARLPRTSLFDYLG